jgi:hypothetical protein
MKIGSDNLVGGGDDPDWWRDEALHIRLDRTAVNRHILKTERSVLIRNFRSRRSVGAARHDHSSALTGKRPSIGGRQRHGSDNRGGRADSGDARRPGERGQ